MAITFDIKTNATARLNALIEKVIKALRREVAVQGHNASGRLSESIEGQTEIGKDSLDGKILALLYGNYINFGVKPNRVKFGGRHHIDALIQWSRDKGISFDSEKDRKSFAFAVTKKQQKLGIPYYKGNTQNGKILGWASDTLDSLQKEILDELGKIGFDIAQETFERTFERVAKEIFDSN